MQSQIYLNFAEAMPLFEACLKGALELNSECKGTVLCRL